MHQLHARQRAAADFPGVELRNAAGELSSVHVANANHVARCKLAFATRDAGRQQTFSRLAQRRPRAVVHKQRAFGMMEKSNPTLSALQFAGLSDKQCSLVLASQDLRENVLL